MHWTVRLICQECSAEIRFEDERPEWKFERGQRYIDCPACGDRAFVPTGPLIDVALGSAMHNLRRSFR